MSGRQKEAELRVSFGLFAGARLVIRYVNVRRGPEILRSTWK